MSYYVSVRQPATGKTVFAAGPFRKHGDAVRLVPQVRRAIGELFGYEAFDAETGTCRDKVGHKRLPHIKIAQWLTERGFEPKDSTLS